MSTPSQPASASTSDIVFYYSEGDDQPLPSHRPTDLSTTGSRMSENGAHGPASGMYTYPQVIFMLFTLLPL